MEEAAYKHRKCCSAEPIGLLRSWHPSSGSREEAIRLDCRHAKE
ncbi:hypothetical protein F444_09309 [Phytophthora nicotianae P1976]|uniref:Uncharacterized protein n=1 Tax=Phytophthora nicotianae P1976 TaxID=1317066 RepID=A0A081A864_PHYNI|nr:hypothetical protein F444_09309 [Phytophthora nicotianae P1976]